MTIRTKELFTIPNLMGYFRILLIPIFMYIYLNAQSVTDTCRALFILILSGITDFFDGIAARKLHQVTQLGKALDPVADKLTLCICWQEILSPCDFMAKSLTVPPLSEKHLL